MADWSCHAGWPHMPPIQDTPQRGGDKDGRTSVSDCCVLRSSVLQLEGLELWVFSHRGQSCARRPETATGGPPAQLFVCTALPRAHTWNAEEEFKHTFHFVETTLSLTWLDWFMWLPCSAGVTRPGVCWCCITRCLCESANAVYWLGLCKVFKHGLSDLWFAELHITDFHLYQDRIQLCSNICML